MNRCVALLLVPAFLLACQPQNSDQDGDTPRPNVLLIVADDLGYADLGSYGSDIRTPTLDTLAAEGLRFSRFHTSPICAPTRAMLLSGTDNHVAGLGSMFRSTDRWGYERHLTDRVATIPQVLGQAGYHAFMAGKWHLGTERGQLPPSHGFDRSFALHQGAANHYNNTFLSRRDSTADYSTNGTPVGWPEGEYSTKVYTDSLIQYVEAHRGSDQPFFAYAAYTAPHWPLQVGESFWRRYEGRYDAGYEALRRSRLASLKDAGMIPEDATLPPLSPEVEPWAQLSEREKTREARKMALYAGMVDNLDRHIGRLIQTLKDIGAYENTVIIFMSDNGAAGEDFYNHPEADFLRSRYENSLENMGRPSSFVSYGPPWAEAGTAPFRGYKGSTYEGGVVAPLIISGPGVEDSGDIVHAPALLTDLAPTLYEMAGVSYPSSVEGTPIEPLAGTSLGPVLRGESTGGRAEGEAWVMEHAGQILVRKGDWKLVNPGKPWEASNFELYDLAEDLSETRDLRKKRPEKFRELLREWRTYRDEKRVVESFE
jgi:arylsulfatase A-like enzyme